jgi:hypothetical protein
MRKDRGDDMNAKKVTLIIAVLAVVIVALFGRSAITQIKSLFMDDNTADLVNTQMYSQEEYEEYLSVASDIAGWTMLDKVNAGLDPTDGSDSDHDGLTDKEEIEVYQSDPLKYSTSGDLYSDKYKVQNGMDLNAYYDYAETVEFKNNKCSEVIFTATKANDLNAYAEEWNCNSIDGYEIYANYRIVNYSGVLSIDVDKIVSDNNIKVSDIIIMQCDWFGEDLKKIKYTVSGNIVTLNNEIKDDDYAVIIIAKSTSFLGINAGTTVNTPEKTTADGGIFDAFILSGFWGKKATIYYIPCGDEEVDRQNKDALIYQATYMFNETLTFDDDDIEIVTQEELDRKRELYGKLFWVENSVPTSNSMALGQYCSLEMVLNAAEASDDDDTDSSETGGESTTERFFVPVFSSRDNLPFENFCSYISTGGNCAGISHLTALVYNSEGELPSSGSYNIDGYFAAWDISVDSENGTLMDKGLNDYKDSKFVKKRKNKKTGILDKSKLSEGELEFVKMIGAYWKEGNVRYNLIRDRRIRYADTSAYSWQMIKNMMDYLDTGKIFDAYFWRLKDDGESDGHAVNIVSYTVMNENCVYFDVYDNNYPDKFQIMKAVRVVHEDGTEVLVFSYAPKKASYSYTSTYKEYTFTAFDENWNYWVDTYDNYSDEQ